MKWSIAFALLVLATPALAQSAPPAPAAGAVGSATPLTPSPDDRAKQWLGLIDDKNYSDAYKQMGAAAQGRIDAAQWSQKLSTAREPLGAMATRTIRSIKMSKTLPGMRDGQYATVQFDASFAHKGAAIETLTLVSDKGAWSVIGYFIN